MMKGDEKGEILSNVQYLVSTIIQFNREPRKNNCVKKVILGERGGNKKIWGLNNDFFKKKIFKEIFFDVGLEDIYACWSRSLEHDKELIGGKRLEILRGGARRGRGGKMTMVDEGRRETSLKSNVKNYPIFLACSLFHL